MDDVEKEAIHFLLLAYLKIAGFFQKLLAASHELFLTVEAVEDASSFYAQKQLEASSFTS